MAESEPVEPGVSGQSVLMGTYIMEAGFCVGVSLDHLAFICSANLFNSNL